MHLPLVDLEAQYTSIKQEIDGAISEVLNSAHFINGKWVKEFEENFASYLDSKYCVSLGNGTDAIYLSLKAIGINKGDEVITVPNTFIATSESISLAGGKIVWCDIDPDTYLMRLDNLESYITSRTKCIIPVHLYGNPVNLFALQKIAKKHSLFILSDTAQAHGAKINNMSIPSLSDIASYSFYPGKNLGAYGDGGAIVTNNKMLAEKVRSIANHGRKEKYIHDQEGINSRLDSIQAAILNVKLKYLNSWTEKRQMLAATYTKKLATIQGIKTPHIEEGVSHVYHLYVIRLLNKSRDELRAFLKDKGIETGVHYPLPLHLQPAYEEQTSELTKERLKQTKEISDQILSLPLYPEMSYDDINYVCLAIEEYMNK
ncbi:MAG: DegT/DnrJ/EryC1/StrS family aminotransferase [Aminobacterium sp.]|jgi:dTDP-4-amino-4,6-dideoxygalactose transaminase|uniref:DegT/DnrJ/EryC1/StrS family aminotransferase n=1 Tax=Aminobacterium sp. TaxID=1872491 RepID=UPI002B21F629|nr:DegT/DnrJ/EryC1/StrS family aminotransferase [Aminobacterium sp.]MEA4877926.1 DegT/DnrJ/EryC1/StrS family aminotransferase [Aminobacterium sp.]